MGLQMTVSLFYQQYWMKWLSLIVRLFVFCFILVNRGMRIHNWQYDTENSFPSWKEGSTLLAQTSIHHENLSSIQEVIVTVLHLILRQFHLSNLQKRAGGVLSTQKKNLRQSAVCSWRRRRENSLGCIYWKPHCLTTSIETSLWASHLQSLQTLLESDGLHPPEARELALCLLNYERNVQSHRKLHHAIRHLRRVANQLIRECKGLIWGVLIKFTKRTHSVICKGGDWSILQCWVMYLRDLHD